MDNALGEVSVVALAKALGKGVAPQLQMLGLNGNELGERSAMALAAAIRAPGALPSLTGLWLGGNGVGEAGRRVLDEAVQSTGREIGVYT